MVAFEVRQPSRQTYQWREIGENFRKNNLLGLELMNGQMRVGFSGSQDATFPTFFALMIGAVGKT